MIASCLCRSYVVRTYLTCLDDPVASAPLYPLNQHFWPGGTALHSKHAMCT